MTDQADRPGSAREREVTLLSDALRQEALRIARAACSMLDPGCPCAVTMADEIEALLLKARDEGLEKAAWLVDDQARPDVYSERRAPDEQLTALAEAVRERKGTR